MNLDNVNTGLVPDDGTGDKLRNAFDTVNENFDSLEVKTQEIDEELLEKDLINTGYLDGLHLTINTDNTKFNISGGSYVVNIDGGVSLLVFDELLAITPAFLSTANATYIGLNVNKQVIQQSSPFTNEQRRSICPIGAVIHSNRTIINTVNQIKAPLKYTLNQLHDVIKVLGSLNLEGNTYSANGTNLQIDKSAGTVFALGINSENPLNPHQLDIASQTGLTFAYRLQNGFQYPDTNLIDPTNYDLDGVLTPLLNNNKWSVQHINLFQSGLTRIQYGQHQYNSLEEAEQKIKTETFITETNIAENSIFRCYLIIKKNATDLSNPSQAKFIPVDKWGNALSGGVAVTYDSIITALGFTPENVANKSTTFETDKTSDVKYPSVKSIDDIVVKKQFSQSVEYTSITGADASIPIPASGASQIVLSNASLTSIVCLDLTAIIGNPSAEAPYPNKIIEITNSTGNDVELKHATGSGIQFFTKDGLSIIIPNKESLYVKYNDDGAVEAFKSWSSISTTQYPKLILHENQIDNSIPIHTGSVGYVLVKTFTLPANSVPRNCTLRISMNVGYKKSANYKFFALLLNNTNVNYGRIINYSTLGTNNNANERAVFSRDIAVLDGFMHANILAHAFNETVSTQEIHTFDETIDNDFNLMVNLADASDWATVRTINFEVLK